MYYLIALVEGARRYTFRLQLDDERLTGMAARQPPRPITGCSSDSLSPKLREQVEKELANEF